MPHLFEIRLPQPLSFNGEGLFGVRLFFSPCARNFQLRYTHSHMDLDVMLGVQDLTLTNIDYSTLIDYDDLNFIFSLT